jgi:hypothetical protein
MMKTYNAIFLALVFLIVSISAAIMLWSQPTSGDLTRISAYPERWFGWNDPQQDIPPVINTPRQTGKFHILVIGDSFSEAGHWQSLLSNHYSFSFIHSGKTTLADILALQGDKKPDAVVIETGERALPDMYGTASTFLQPVTHCQLPAATQENTPALAEIQARMAQLPTFPLTQRKRWPSNGNNISEGFHIFKIYSSALIKPKKRKAKVLALTSDQLFSSGKPDHILLLSKDFLLYDSIDDNNLNTVHCTMQAVDRALTQAQLPHVILTLPDKTTAYQPYLADTKIKQRLALINRLRMDALTGHDINMLQPIRSLIAAGNKDVYLPNDTHWGYKGFQLAAVLINEKLSAQLPTKNTTQVTQP